MAREIRLVITQRCMQNCLYCHREGMGGMEKEQLTADDYQFIFKIANKFSGIKRVTITGGEPFLRKDLEEILAKLKLAKARIKLISNGVLLKKHLTVLQFINNLSISFTSFDPVQHQRVHGYRGLAEVISGVKKASKLKGKTEIKINICCVKGVNDNEVEINKFLEFGKENGVNLKFIELLNPPAGIFVPIETFVKKIDNLGLKFLKKQREKWFYVFKNTVIVELQRCLCADVKRTADLSFCRQENDIFISPDAKIKPCMLKDKKEIDILDIVKQRNKERLKNIYKQTIAQFGDHCPMLTRKEQYESSFHRFS